MTERPAATFLCPVTIGRRRELAAARSQLARGDGGVLVIAGEAGIGKSRLVRELCASAGAAGMRVLQAASFEADRALPYSPIGDLLRALAAAIPPDAITALAGPALPDLARLAKELGAPAAEPADAAADPETRKRRQFDAVDRLIQRVAADVPLLVTVEDVHWSDDVGLECLLHLARRGRGRRVTFFVTYRREETHPALERFLANLDRERLATDMTLERLGPADVGAMLGAIFGLPRPAPADLLHAIVGLTDGNPFFVEEMLKTLSAAGPILTPEGRWSRRPGDDVHIPRSVRDAVRRRRDALNPGVRERLTLAAVIGRRFDFDLLRRLTGDSEAQTLACVKELIAAQLVVEESADRFAFRHALTRQAVYADLLERERRALHRRVAEAMERADDAPGAWIIELSDHLFAAQIWDKTLHHARLAGERAAALHAPRAAVEHFSRAIEARRRLGLPPDAPLLRARGQAYETLGEFEPARADHDAALAIARERGDLRAEWRALLDLGLLWASRDYDRSGDFAQQALAAARRLGDDRVAHSLNRVGNWRLNSEQPHAARACHEEALTIFEAAGDRAGVAETLDLLGITSLIGGEIAASSAYFGRAVAFCRDLGDRRGRRLRLDWPGHQRPFVSHRHLAADRPPR